jgi:hypothetical protein
MVENVDETQGQWKSHRRWIGGGHVDRKVPRPPILGKGRSEPTDGQWVASFRKIHTLIGGAIRRWRRSPLARLPEAIRAPTE